MNKRDEHRKPKILKDLAKNIQPNKFQNMMILGLNITLDMVKSDKDKDRVIVYLNNSLINSRKEFINSRKEFDQLIKDIIEYKFKQDNLKAHIMAKREEYKKIDPEIFKLVDQADE